MRPESTILAKSLYSMTKLVTAALFLLSLGISVTAKADYTCSQLFESSTYAYQNYNPTSALSEIDFLSRPGVFELLKQKIVKDENIDLLRDHVLFLRTMFLQITETTQSKKIANSALVQIKEIEKRILEKKMTYFWIWKMSLTASFLKFNADQFTSGKKVLFNPLITKPSIPNIIGSVRQFLNPTATEELARLQADTKNQEGANKYADAKELFDLLRSLSAMGVSTQKLAMIFSIPNRENVIIPSVNLQPFEHFLETETKNLDFAGVAFSPAAFDGMDEGRMDRDGYLLVPNHDAGHLILEISDRESAGSMWPTIHEKIYEKIKRLSNLKRTCAAFIYWNLLHEKYFRTEIVSAVLEKNPNIVFNNPVLSFQTRGTLPLRDQIILELKTPNFFGKDFKDFFNIESVYDVGAAALQKILIEVSGDMP